MNTINEFIKKSKNGDEEAFTYLIQYIEDDLYRIAEIRLKSIDDINEAIQKTIINIYKNINKIRNDKYFKTWAIKILINETNKLYKINKKKMNISEISTIENNIYIDNEINKLEEELDFKILIKNLNDDEKLILTLKYNSEYSLQDISKILNMNVNTVKTKYLRLKEKLKKNYYERNDING